jgi:hypothetical protein
MMIWFFSNLVAIVPALGMALDCGAFGNGRYEYFLPIAWAIHWLFMGCL